MSPVFPAPSANPHLFGHAAARERFLRALSADRLHPAWLITGPAGIGKATLAWHLARELLATGDEPPHAPEGVLFRSVASNAHPDLFPLEAERARGGRLADIPVARARELLERLHLTAAHGRRVVLVDPADALGRSAANALLKLIEEPPAGLVFLIVAHRPQTLPATLASRCLRLPLAPLARAEVDSALRTLAPSLDEAGIARLVEFAQGRVGRAAMAADGRFFSLYGQLLDLLERPPALAALVEYTTALERWAGEVGLETAIAVPSLLLRRIAYQHVAASEMVPLVENEPAHLRRLAARTPLERIGPLWEKLDGLPRQVEGRYLDPAQALLTMLDALVRDLGPVADARASS